MNKIDLSKKIGKLRSQHQKSINDLMIWCNVALEGMKSALQDDDFKGQKVFLVPRKMQNQSVKRTKDQVRNILTNAVDHDVHYSLFVYLVAKGEAFFHDVMYNVLQYDNRKLLISTPGIDGVKNVKTETIIKSSDLDCLIQAVIDRQLDVVTYARPVAQFLYIEKISGVEVDSDLIGLWSEAKAIRDLVVHNSGIINETYINKSGDRARGNLGDEIIIDRTYFEDTAISLKTIIGKVSNDLQHDLRT